MPLVPGDVNRVPPGATQLIIKCKFTKTSRELSNNLVIPGQQTVQASRSLRGGARRGFFGYRVGSFAVTGPNPTSTFPQFNVDKIDIEINTQPGCVGN